MIPLANICPLCNGMQFDQVPCPACQGDMVDRGRYTDFFDDYSPYLDIDGMKKEDGILNDLQNHQCPHVFECLLCSNQQIRIINEVFIP